MSKWTICKISDICTSVSVTYRGTDEYVVLINTSDVLDGKILNNDITENKNLKGQFKKTFKKDDILYSEIRPANRRFAYVDINDTSNYIASTKLMVLRCDTTKVIPKFLYYVLRSEYIINELQLLAETRSGTFPQITFSGELGPMEIKLPDLNIQQKIVSILNSIEEKIELNDNINSNLEQQGYALFVDKFIKNNPDNWIQGTLSDIGTIIGGGTPSKAKTEFYCEDGLAWITPKDLSINKNKFISHGENDITEIGLKNSSAVMMPRGTVLFSSRAPIGYIAISKNGVSTNQGFKSVIPNSDVGTPYIYYFLKHYLPVIENMASGSTFKEVSGVVMKSFPAIVPDDKTLADFNDICYSLFDEQEQLESENNILISVRETLLKKLLTGEIDLTDIDI